MYNFSLIKNLLIFALGVQASCFASDQDEKKPFAFHFSPDFLQVLSSPSDQERKEANPFAFKASTETVAQSHKSNIQPLSESLFNDFEQAYKYFQNSANTVEEEVGRQIIRNIALQESHPYRYEGLMVLLESSHKYDNALSKELLFRTLLSPHNHLFHEKAADILFKVSKISLEEQLIGARVIIKNKMHDQRFSAAEKLFLAGKTTKDTQKALSVFREIVEEFVLHKDSFPAALILEKQGERDKALALATFRRIVLTFPFHSSKFDATKRLDLNGSEQDKTLVLTSYSEITVNNSWDHPKRLLAADRLYNSNIDNHKITALNYYISVFQAYPQELKPDLYYKLLKSTLPAHSAFAREDILAESQKKNYDILFSHGDDKDRSITRGRLYNLVEMPAATIQGPKAAYALLKYGDNKDKQFIIKLADKGNAFAQEAVNRLKKD